MLVLAAGAFLIFGLAISDARPVAVSLAAGGGAIVFLWAGIARSAPPAAGTPRLADRDVDPRPDR